MLPFTESFLFKRIRNFITSLQDILKSPSKDDLGIAVSADAAEEPCFENGQRFQETPSNYENTAGSQNEAVV